MGMPRRPAGRITPRRGSVARGSTREDHRRAVMPTGKGGRRPVPRPPIPPAIPQPPPAPPTVAGFATASKPAPAAGSGISGSPRSAGHWCVRQTPGSPPGRPRATSPPRQDIRPPGPAPPPPPGGHAPTRTTMKAERTPPGRPPTAGPMVCVIARTGYPASGRVCRGGDASGRLNPPPMVPATWKRSWRDVPEGFFRFLGPRRRLPDHARLRHGASGRRR